MTDERRLQLLVATGAGAFCLLVTLNAGGYRYGVADQAFYVPVVLQELTPELYPHDADVIAAQDRFFLFDDWFAPILRVTGLSLPTGFLVAYYTTLVLLYGALVSLGRRLSSSWWTVTGLVVGLTMRHRIPDTAVNSLEGYFHPRLLAFALGLWAVVALLHGRSWSSLVVAGSALLVHPTTGLWFGVLVGVAAFIADSVARPRILGLAALAGGGVAWAVQGPLASQLVVMDSTWVTLLSVKDYLVPGDWPASTWVGNLSMATAIGVVYGYRRSRGLTSPRETGLVAGCLTLLVLFLLSVPLTSAHIALAVQLQLNRVFWLFDVLGSAYMAWLLIESPGWPGGPWRWVRVTPRPAIVVTVLILALARGAYVSLVEPAGRPIRDDPTVARDWHQVMHWASTQPVGTHFLADPGHAALYGTSIRVASARDVYLEIVKDTGMAIYSAPIAHRVARRLDALGDFNGLGESRARALARRFDIDYLITEHELDLPLTRAVGHFRVYDLRG